MPSTPSSARPRGAHRAGPGGRVAALLAALVMVLGIPGAAALGITPEESIAAPVRGDRALPQRPVHQPADGPQLDLGAIGPASLAPGDTLTVEVTATNTTSEPIAAPRLDLSTLTPRVTDRAVLEAWQRDSRPQADRPVATSADPVAPLAPGESRTLTVSVPADQLGYSTSPDLWGTRRVALTLDSDGTDLATLRTFIVWRPAGTTESVAQSVLLPVGAHDPGLAATDPAQYGESLTSGTLAGMRRLAARPDVDWLLDPALLDPPALAPSSSSDPTAGAGTYAPSEGSRALAEELVAGAGDRTVLTMPYAQADLESVDAAGAGRLREILAARGREAIETSGIVTSGTAVAVAGPRADPAAMTRAADSGSDVLITSSASLREDLRTSVTPSSIGVLAVDGARIPVLAPDPVLSDELAALTPGTDTEQTTQRLLAETAVIAEEPARAPRQILISPPAGTELDVDATARTLDALGQAPWLTHARTADLLAQADPTGRDRDIPSTLGTVGPEDVRPSGLGADGALDHLDAPAGTRLLDAGVVRKVEDSATHLDALRSSMADTAPADVADLTVLSAVSDSWRGDPDGMSQRADAAHRAAADLGGRVSAEPASNYTLIASESSVPVTLTNDLDTPVTVTLDVSADQPLVRLPESPPTVEIPARGRATASVPVEAVANGQVELTVALRALSGATISEPRSVSLTVSPAWENRTTTVLVIAMGLLVVVGVLRARRTGSDRRAPAVRGPEDPGTLASTGRSEPAHDRPAPADHEPRPDPNGSTVHD